MSNELSNAEMYLYTTRCSLRVVEKQSDDPVTLRKIKRLLKRVENLRKDVELLITEEGKKEGTYGIHRLDREGK